MDYTFFMGIESGPKFTPGEEKDSSDSQNQQNQPGKADWSYVEERMAKKREEELAAMSSEEREKAVAEDKRIKEQADEVRQWAQGKQKKLAGPQKLGKDSSPQPIEEARGRQLIPRVTNIDEGKERMAQQHEKDAKTIREQEYQKVKAEMHRFRKEHDIQKTEEELVEEDRELRKKFGLE